jgi:hypothetical protein
MIETSSVVPIANDDSRKFAEALALEPFLDEYKHVTGIGLVIVAAIERPDFICTRKGRRVGLELVRAMPDPAQTIRAEGQRLDGLEAAVHVQDAVYAKEAKRASTGWQLPDDTILVVQLLGSDAEETAQFLDEQLMNEMASTGFREIWAADYSQMEPYGTVQLIGIKPRRWRGVHEYRGYGMKPFG